MLPHDLVVTAILEQHALPERHFLHSLFGQFSDHDVGFYVDDLIDDLEDGYLPFLVYSRDRYDPLLGDRFDEAYGMVRLARIPAGGELVAVLLRQQDLRVRVGRGRLYRWRDDVDVWPKLFVE